MRYTPRSSGSANPGRSGRSANTVGKVAVAAGSAALLFGALGSTSFAAGSSRSTDVPVCTSLGGVLATAGQICTGVVDALPLPALPVPALPVPALPALPSGSALPDLASVLPALPSGSPAASPSTGLPDLTSVLSGVGGGPAAGLPTSGLPTSGLPAGGAPSLAVVPGAVATVFNTADPIIGTLHDSLPDAVTGALPVSTLTGALSPVTGPVLGAVNTVGHAVTTALPMTAPIINPLLSTVNALPGQVNTLLGTLANGSPAAGPTVAALPSIATVPAVATAEPGVVSETESATDRASSDRAANVASEPVPEVAPIAAVAKTAKNTSDSLPVTGFGFAGIGLAGAIAISWGSFARALAARKKLVPES